MGIFKRILSRDPERRGVLFSGLFGKQLGGGVDVSGKGNDIVSMLRTAYGPGPRGNAVDTRSAAKELGVSQRTVQRWIAAKDHQHAKPKPSHLKAIRKASRQAATTKKGRQRHIAKARSSPQARKIDQLGGQLTVKAKSGVVSGGKAYVRDRLPVKFKVPPRDIDAMWSAYEQGGEKGFSQWLTSWADSNYVDGFEFEKISNISLEPLEKGAIDPDRF